ncbi:MAG TPA: hypothetical protein VI791_02500 [Patescibacteria group bacterium]|nr:hypothetical protein [Patescibacteria group bacterium]
MYNWSTDTSKLSRHPQKYTLWKLEQLINYGLGGQKISLQLLKKNWPKLNLDPHYKKTLEFFLWPKRF